MASAGRLSADVLFLDVGQSTIEDFKAKIVRAGTVLETAPWALAKRTFLQRIPRSCGGFGGRAR